MRLPVAANTALVTAGITGGSIGSPRPDGGNSVLRKETSIFGVCFGGGGGGTDHYSVATLQNQWALAALHLELPYGDGKVTGVSGFSTGSSQIGGDVSWKVDSCQVVDYTLQLIAAGPRGVPMQ